MRECPDCEIPLQRGKCRKCGWQYEAPKASKPKVKLIKDCSWRGAGAPCPNLATMYPLTFDPNAEGLCGEHWSAKQQVITETDEASVRSSMAKIRQLLGNMPSPPSAAELASANEGW